MNAGKHFRTRINTKQILPMIGVYDVFSALVPLSILMVFLSVDLVLQLVIMVSQILGLLIGKTK